MRLAPDLQDIAQRASAQQRLASDPQTSVWVCASAGSGKTKVLIDRMIHLLLCGAHPQRLLCLTFTTAAAGEMANRLQQKLSLWASAPRDVVESELAMLLGYKPDLDTLTRARGLFALALDAPGGLKIMTIHAFCQSLLRQFPLEAQTNPYFQVIDAQQAQEALRQAHLSVLQDKNPDLAPHLNLLTQMMDEYRFQEVLLELRNGPRTPIEELPAYQAWLEKTLNTQLSDTPHALRTAILQNAPCQILGSFITALESGSAVDQQKAQVLRDLFAGCADESAYIRIFCTEKGEPRKAFATQKVLQAAPQLPKVFGQECARIQDILGRVADAHCAHISLALATVGAHITQAYQDRKRAQNWLDYEDLIVYTAALLRRRDLAPWVLYKIDGGLDHILVDEAQDTNASQWAIIVALVQEFFAHLPCTHNPRTLFVVGDEKQSIYSFQGADARIFSQMRRTLRAAALQGSHAWRDIALNISFRSTQAVLDAVDHVFAPVQAHQGVTEEITWPCHQAFRRGEGGHVIVWPLIDQEDAPPAAAWAPAGPTAAPPAARQLAYKIADTVRDWLDQGTLLRSQNRPIAPRDILILVQRRNQFVTELVRALKSRGVPIAGSDRLNLKSHLAVQDIVALARFVCLPEDDLNLATVLKGPFFNVDEEDLFALCYGRPETVWACVQERRPDLATRLEMFQDWGARFDLYSFFHAILDLAGGRQEILRRLGPDSADYLDEFLHIVMHFDQRDHATLQHFIHWFESAEIDLRREHTAEVNAVRIMTVHGAKGLQAPIVFLPDTAHVPQMRSPLVWHQDQPLWRGGSVDRSARVTQIVQQSYDRALQEHRRLLYVAMTRAQDQLYLCGYTTKRGASTQAWYHAISNGLSGVARFEEEDLILSCPHTVAMGASVVVDPPEAVISPLPDWLAPLLQQPAPPALQKSAPEPGDAQAAQRGTWLHKLLQHLPSISPDDRLRVGRRLLHNLEPQDRDALIDLVLRVLKNPELAFIFSAQALAEVPVTLIHADQVMTYQMDRLVFLPQALLIVDFKSTAQGKGPGAVPPEYRAQILGYKRAIAKLYPDHQVRGAILWIEANVLEPVN